MAPHKPSVTIVGSLGIDYTTFTSNFPSPGETLTAISLNILPGGKGANQAAACGRAAFKSRDGEQDAEVRIVGAVGGRPEDQWSSMLKPVLEGAGVSCEDGIRKVDGCHTGTATIIVDDSGENRILVVPGANHKGMDDSEEVLERVFGGGKKLDVLVMQGEIPKATVLDVLAHNQKMEKSCKVVLNPAPVFPGAIPTKLLKGVSLIVNETEILQLTKSSLTVPMPVTATERLDRHSLDIFANNFHAAGVATLIVTLGSRGVYCSMNPHDPSSMRSEPALIPGVKVPEVIETTAAGDTFVGYYATALARWCAAESGRDFPFKQAVETANRAAAICVQRPGSMDSIPWGYEVNPEL